MLKIKDVSKFYYNKGVIASGFTKVSAEFKLGEFVAITGESGSGKSTLLNVLSGLDSYEEGEMYINGAETSHYGEAEFEDYRKKYIGNIFQNFNLVNSYSVEQNVELVLLINGYKKRETKQKVANILKEVDLYKFRKTKVSKLSGGQKQRVAIARALAKETPILVADEPTGNLDSKAAASVLETLANIAKNKLVIVVTHNYEQVEKYVTRKIKMHDGRIVEDKVIKAVKEEAEPEASSYKPILKTSKLRLGLRNTFNIIPKFLLLFFVYFLIVAALLAEYTAFKKLEYEESKMGYNQFFQDISDNRIVIKKADGSPFTETDYQKLEKLPNVNYIVKDDLVLDMQIGFSYSDFQIYGLVKSLNLLEGGVDLGRLPQNENEVVFVGNRHDYYIQEAKDMLLDKEFHLVNAYTGEANKNVKVKVVGVKYAPGSNWQYYFYVNENVLEEIRAGYNQQYSNIRVLFADKYYTSDIWSPYMQVVANNKVPAGAAYISEDLSYLCTNFNCKNKKLKIENTNVYYKNTKELKVTKTYHENNFTSLTGLKKINDHRGKIFVNPSDYAALYNEAPYQSSVFVKDIKLLDETASAIEALNISPLKVRDAIVKYNPEEAQVIRLMRLIVTIILVVVVFFVAYFIIKIILKSRNVYFSTLRILGASKKVSKQLLDIELFTIYNLVYFVIVGFVYLVNIDVIKLASIKDLASYASLLDYAIIYVILLGMTQLISNKFAKSLFKKSAMKTYFEEV